MKITRQEHGRRTIALVRAVKANDIAKVRQFLKDCRWEWDSVHHRTGGHSDIKACSCCFKCQDVLFPAKDAALRTAIALGLGNIVNLILDAGIQFSPGGCMSEAFSSTAVKLEQIDMLRLLFERNIGSTVNMEYLAGERAIIQGSLPLTELFIEYGSATRGQVINLAIEHGKLELVQSLTEMPLAAPELSGLLNEVFFELIRQLDATQVPRVALKVFEEASTRPILEFCKPFTNGMSDCDRNIIMQNTLMCQTTSVAHFLILYGAKYIQSKGADLWLYTHPESDFLYLWNLLGGTGNFNALMSETDQRIPPVYHAISHGFWEVLETCLRYPAFKMRKTHPTDMIHASNRAIKDGKEKVLWHFVKNVPESRPMILTDVDLPISRSPALIRIMSRCRQHMIRTIKTPALRWEMSALSDIFFNLFVHLKLRPMEVVVAPIGLDPETQTAAVAALRRICLLTMRLMADNNKDESVKQDLRYELMTCAALPGCNTIPQYFAYNICTEALERNEPVLFAIIRDALTGPSYPDGGFFYSHDKLKQRWLAIAALQGLQDAVRVLIPSSPAENVALHQLKAPSPKCSISTSDKELWQSAVKGAINEREYVVLELLRQTQYTISGHDANELAVILLEPAFIANDHSLLRYLRGIGVPYPPWSFDHLFLSALYHDLNPEKRACTKINQDNTSSIYEYEPAHTTMESICVYLGITDMDFDFQTSDTDEGDHGGMLFSDGTFVPQSNQLTRISCQGSCHVRRLFGRQI
ncbi:hypothetical protein DFS34DRAFT_667056 [Phlyctochytrium arcticum]|nr:hypothetical protein DFS34DRAFT_667056 [Phlyctochytrium arcticum]